MGQGGKLSVARVLRGGFHEGDTVIGSRGGEARIGSLLALTGAATARIAEAKAGETVGFGRSRRSCDRRLLRGRQDAAGGHPVECAAGAGLCACRCKIKDRKDDVRLSGALAKIAEEDPSLVVETSPEMGEIRLLGQGEMHLRVGVERLQSRFQVGVETAKPRIGYCETIRAPASARGRHRKQTGGHGQFGDVMIEITPLPRGEGFAFVDASRAASCRDSTSRPSRPARGMR